MTQGYLYQLMYCCLICLLFDIFTRSQINGLWLLLYLDAVIARSTFNSCWVLSRLKFCCFDDFVNSATSFYSLQCVVQLDQWISKTSLLFCIVTEMPSLICVRPLFWPQRWVTAARLAGGDEWTTYGELLQCASEPKSQNNKKTCLNAYYYHNKANKVVIFLHRKDKGAVGFSSRGPILRLHWTFSRRNLYVSTRKHGIWICGAFY